jgi:ABC-2 type transport system permease protein
MTTPSNAMPEPALDARAVAPAALPATRGLFWSVRREVWENRSIYVAPLAAAVLVLMGFSIRTLTLPQRLRAMSALDPAQQRAAIALPYNMTAVLIIFTTLIVAVFYCLDALHGERRDRSILFWKSLPVSDLTTVLAKTCVPLVVLPLVAFAISIPAQLVLLLLSSAVLLASGGSAAAPWTSFPLVRESLILLYGLAVHALWFAPIYGWLLLISAWARRTPFLWAVLPPLAIGGLEHIAWRTSHFGSLVRYRVMGAMGEAFTAEVQRSGHADRLSQLDPASFLTSSGLWVGLAFAAAFLTAATRLRRYRGPI